MTELTETTSEKDVDLANPDNDSITSRLLDDYYKGGSWEVYDIMDLYYFQWISKVTCYSITPTYGPFHNEDKARHALAELMMAKGWPENNVLDRYYEAWDEAVC